MFLDQKETGVNGDILCAVVVEGAVEDEDEGDTFAISKMMRLAWQKHSIAIALP